MKLHFPCDKCTLVIGVRVTEVLLGKTLELTHPSCDGITRVIIPLNALQLWQRGIRDEDIPEEDSDIFGDIFKQFGKKNKWN